MNEKHPVLFILLFAGFVLMVILIMQPLEIVYQKPIAFLFPSGLIAREQRNLLYYIQVLMLFVVIPVYLLTFIFSWKYRADNTKAKYTPDWGDSYLAEVIWWGLPCLLIILIGALTWVDTYALDPYKPIKSDKKPIHIQVVALQWKWLFIYPDYGVASVNFLQFPEKTPLSFDITADAPMNSFWIPRLGGQIYAMPNMVTKLHLIADEIGESRGSSANLSGDGFSGMHFVAKASSEEDFEKWIQSAKESGGSLDWKSYESLALPSHNNPVSIYSLGDENLFDQVIMKYRVPHE